MDCTRHGIAGAQLIPLAFLSACRRCRVPAARHSVPWARATHPPTYPALRGSEACVLCASHSSPSSSFAPRQRVPTPRRPRTPWIPAPRNRDPAPHPRSRPASCRGGAPRCQHCLCSRRCRFRLPRRHRARACRRRRARGRSSRRGSSFRPPRAPTASSMPLASRPLPSRQSGHLCALPARTRASPRAACRRGPRSPHFLGWDSCRL